MSQTPVLREGFLRRPAGAFLAAATLAAVVLVPVTCHALEDAPAVVAPLPGGPLLSPLPADGPAGPGSEEERNFAPPGMVLFPGGTVKIGVDEKALKTWVAATEVGRMEKNAQESAWRSELVAAVPEHTVDLPPFWIGRHEVTNAQYNRWLQATARVVYEVPSKDVPGARTLEEVSRLHLLVPPFENGARELVFVTTVDWKQLYGINREVLDPDGKIGVYDFKDRAIPPGTKLVTFTRSLPGAWKEKNLQLPEPPVGQGDWPVTGVSLLDAEAFARDHGCHIPTGYEWEAACRGPEGFPFPEGKEFDPLGHAWKGFNAALDKAKKEAAGRLPKAQEELAATDPTTPKGKRLAAEVARLEWVTKAASLPEGTIAVPVGLFPYGVSPIGAHDMLGNVDEWTSGGLVKYPGHDSTIYDWGSAFALRGGNLLDKDTLLHSTFRKFKGGGAIQPYWRFDSGGFRVARSAIPGLSMARHAILRAEQAVPHILPGEQDKKFVATFVGLDSASATGIAQYDEVSAATDPMGKVYHLGKARGLCIVPADGTPLIDSGRLGKAAEGAEPPTAKGAPDKRTPRDIPFLGLLHMTDDLGLKGEVFTTKVTWEKVTVAPDKKKDEAPPEEGGKDEKPPSDPKTKMPLEDDKPAPAGEKDGEGAGDGKEGEKGENEEEAQEEEEEPAPTILDKRVVTESYVTGILRGSDHPDGLLLGYGKYEGVRRPALWPSRASSRGGLAPGGTVLLEKPVLLLDEKAISFKKVSKAFRGTSVLDTVAGQLTVTFFVAFEGKSKGGWEVTLVLPLGDFEPGPSTRPWHALPPLKE